MVGHYRSAADQVPGPGERLWLDQPDAREQVDRRSSDPTLRRRAGELIDHGVTRIEGAVDQAQCDRVRVEYERYCHDHAAESATYWNAQGHRSRLSNLHMVSDAACEVGTNPRVMELLDYLFGYRAAVYSSLTFERGSQQDIHRDSPYFCTEPRGFFFGVWTALEDVRPDAGPIVYLEGAHRIDIDAHRLAAEVDRLNTARPGEPPLNCGRVYNERIVQLAEAQRHHRVVPRLVKGDTLIWHPELPHGGCPIESANATRTSIVFHCVPEGVPVFGPERFYSGARAERWDPVSYSERYGRRIFDRQVPHFQPND